jgi:toxin CptA
MAIRNRTAHCHAQISSNTIPTGPPRASAAEAYIALRVPLPLVRALAARWRSLLPALVVVITLPWLWRSLVAAPQLHVDVGTWGDHVYLTGTHAIEVSPGEDFRWTTAHAELTLPNLGDQYRLLRLRAYAWRPNGQPPPAVDIDVAGQPWGRIQPTPELRIYHVLLPREPANPLIRVGLTTNAQAQPGDPRELGVALDWVEVRTLGRPGSPGLWQLGGQALLLGLLALLLVALALPIGWALALATLCGAALVWANFVQPLWVSSALVPWLIVVAGLLCATFWLAPRLRRAAAPWLSPDQARLAWALFVGALAVRLLGAVHPLFNAHDLDVHTRWLDIVRSGQLYLYSTPGEFRGQETFNPPAGYLALMPLSLLLSARLAVQVGVALLDALGGLAL